MKARTVGVLWGATVVLLSLLAWGGQILAWLAPDLAVRLTVMEPEDSVEPTYWADIRGEAPFDFITLWTMVVAGVLLILDQASWAYFGLVGGGMYVYFAGRGIFTRIAMERRGFSGRGTQEPQAGISHACDLGSHGPHHHRRCGDRSSGVVTDC